MGDTRPPGWTYADYQREVAAYVARLRPLTYGPRLSGPSAFGALGKNAAPFVRTFHSALNMVTVHSYALSACDIQGRPFATTDPRYPSATRLLSSGVLFSGMGNWGAAARAAAPYRLPVRFTETNSIACGGKDGVSNAMPAALWGLDFMMLYGILGVSGMDFHISPLYGPIFNGIGAPRQLGVNPLYYAMLMFSEATAYGARFLNSVSTTQRTSYGFNARIWGTLNSRRTARIVALNKSLSRSGFASLRVPGARRASR